MRPLPFILSACLLASATMQAQQITRKQLTQKFYQATQYHNSGQDSLAIARLEEVAELMPNFALTYRREAEIYDDMGRKGDSLAINGAILMYRRYLSLELNEEKTLEPRKRLMELENAMKISHFEEAQRQQAQEEEKQEIALATIDENQEENLQDFVMSVSRSNSVASIRSGRGRRQPRAISNQPATGPETPLASTGAQETPATAAETPVASAETPAVTHPESTLPTSTSTASSTQGKTFSYLSHYNLEIPSQPISTTHEVRKMGSQEITGHWVSSLSNSDGREFWIFDIQPFGNEFSVTLSPSAGVSNPVPEEGLYKRALKLLRTYNILGDDKFEISDPTSSATINNNRLSFVIRSEKNHLPNTSVYKWTNQLLTDVVPALPFGGIISKLGQSLTNSLSEKDIAATYSYDMSFDCTLTGEGVMECYFTQRGKQVSTKGTKSLATKKKTFVLYRTADSYDHFQPEDIEVQNEDKTDLFNEVCDRAETDTAAYYALGLLYHYGVGCEASDKKAFECMTLATCSDMAPRAMRWLTNSYREAAAEADKMSFWTRRKYKKMSELWLKEMHRQQMPSYYGIKADMLLDEEEKSLNDSAIVYFKQGAIAGDPYSCLRYGMMISGTHENAQAIEMLQQAGKGGEADAYLYLANIYRDGTGVAADATQYLKYLTMAIDGGSVDALRELSNAYLQGTILPQNFVQGNVIRNYFMQASQNQWMDELYSMGFNIDQVK